MSDSSDKKDLESELKAIRTIIEALSGLSEPTKYRVLSYALEHLKISFTSSHAPTVTGIPQEMAASGAPEAIIQPVLHTKATAITDIRSLKEAKSPTSANEMAALVAYYLSELAPSEERKSAIVTKDIEKYFKQAGFPLPGALKYTLGNAASAGYFDKTENGYKLNPVGYNLVVHGLPSSENKKAKARNSGRKAPKKKSRSRKPR